MPKNVLLKNGQARNYLKIRAVRIIVDLREMCAAYKPRALYCVEARRFDRRQERKSAGMEKIKNGARLRR